MAIHASGSHQYTIRESAINGVTFAEFIKDLNRSIMHRDPAAASVYMAVCILQHLRAGSVPVFPPASMQIDDQADVSLLKFSM
jgi:hypothetical protein